MPSPLTKLAEATANFSRGRVELNETAWRPVPKLLTRSVHEVDKVSRAGHPFSPSDLPAYIDAVKNMNGVGLDDRKFLLEKLLILMSRLPKGSKLGKAIEQYVVGLLYRDLPHPPGPYLALPPAGTIPYPQPAGVHYAYRSADGSYYNPLTPSLGKVGMPYARSVPTKATTPVSHLPDAATVFDTLLRRDQFIPHPGGLSSLFFAFADLIIHSIFETSHADWSINNASSYLDLGILYGSSEKQVNSVRRLDGSGKIWNDVFADPRFLFMPPSVCALLIIFSRNHNYVADKILSINEKSTFSPLPLADSAARTAQDDEIFHRARLVNTGFFMQVILRDYIGVILGMVRDGSTWRLNPLEAARDSDHSFIPRGEGNVVSIEFNLLYRWHACISEQDTAWTEQVFEKLFPGKDWDQITVADFQAAAAGKTMRPGPDVKAWTFGGLERGSDGSFKDADIANFLHSATESAACGFKARGIPSVLRVIEIMGIEQGRAWGVCSLNEFRKFVGLKPYESFEEWNPDPKIHQAAANLYQDIDRLELHVGMQAEETKHPMPGAGLCPGYTISRAILSDAVCLTRGDRFMTTEFTPFNLTIWGYNDCQFDENDGSFGGMLSKLLFRHLPEYYPPGSAYAHFAFIVPEAMRGYISGRGYSEDDYTWMRPTKTPLGLGTIEDRVQNLVRYPLVSVKEPFFSSRAVEHTASSFFHITKRLIEERFTLDMDSTARHLNIVGDVVNLVPIYWITEEIGDPPTKSRTDPAGDVKDVYSSFSEVTDYIFANIEHSRDWALHKASTQTVCKFSSLIEVLLRNSTDGLLNALKRFLKLGPSYPVHESLMKRLSKVFGQPQNVAASVFMETAATAALFSKAVALVIDYIFNNLKAKDVHNYLHPKDAKGDGGVISLIREALHLQEPGHYWDEQVLGVRPTESPLENYGLLDPSFFEKATVEILRAVFTRDDIVKRPNQPVNMGSFNNQIAKDHIVQSYLDDQGSVTPWPTTLIICFDGHHSSA